MQIIKYADRTVHQTHDNARVDEYYMHNKLIDLCVVHINGRTPLKGKLVNSDFSCVCYVLNGSGFVCGDSISVGDAFNILAHEPYWFDGNFIMIMCGTPAFNPNQCQIID